MASQASNLGSLNPPSAPRDPRLADRSSFQSYLNGPRFPNAERVSFAAFNNKYAGGTCYVVGRGPTDFDYAGLAGIADPIFFINDAICLEKYARSETFFFAHDRGMRAWLDGSMRAAAVLPIEGKVLGNARRLILRHAGPVVYYHRGQRARTDLLQLTRDEIADREELFIHAGTIHSTLHFIWFCGFRRVVYIGCDGINQPQILARACGSDRGYDPRLQNRSHTTAGWQYDTIRRAQDLLAAFFGIETQYLGTPPCRG